MEKSLTTPYFYLNSSIPTYVGKEPLKKTILTVHQKRVLYYIRLLEGEHPIPVVSSDRCDTQNLYFHTNYAFYADPICTGKSFVILSLLSLHRCVERKKLMTIWSNGIGMNVFSKIQNFEIPLSILVTPQSSLAQWDNLFKEETNIKYFIIDSESTIDEINTYEYEVLIIADTFFDKVCLLFQGFSVSRIIFDDLLHLEIKEIHPSSNPSEDINLFGNLRSSFTWFVSSDPHACLQKYRNTRLPFSNLIKQIFTFPYSGLIFRNEDLTLEQSLSVILPEIEFSFDSVFLQKTEEDLIFQNELEKILESKSKSHLLSFFIYRIHMKMSSIDDILKDQSLDKIKSIKERYESWIDPVTYEKIECPIIVSCCHHFFDLNSISKCLVHDKRCPLCRKEMKWEDIIGIKTSSSPPLDKDIWSLIQNINLQEYNVFYIPSLNKDIPIDKRSRNKIHVFIRELRKRYKCFIFSKKSNSKKIFDEFKKEKGILIIAKPIQANLHLSYVDRVFVLHPKEYKSINHNVWFTNYFKSYYSPQHPILQENWNNRTMITLSDHELGNFCIGKQNKLYITCMTFL
jgi:hypothetical protein